MKLNEIPKEELELMGYDDIAYLILKEAGKKMKLLDLFKKVCKDYGLKYKVKVATKYKPEGYVHNNKTLYNIIKRGMDLASINDNKQYFIADRFGTLTWSELGSEKTNIQLGGGSMVTSYTYEKSIDDDTFNQVKLYRDNKDTGKRDVWIVKNSNKIKKWGTLQLLKQADDDWNGNQPMFTCELSRCGESVLPNDFCSYAV